MGENTITWSPGTKKGAFLISSNLFTLTTPPNCIAIVTFGFDPNSFADIDVDMLKARHETAALEIVAYFQDEWNLRPKLVIKNYWDGKSVSMYVCSRNSVGRDQWKLCFLKMEEDCKASVEA